MKNKYQLTDEKPIHEVILSQYGSLKYKDYYANEIVRLMKHNDREFTLVYRDDGNTRVCAIFEWRDTDYDNATVLDGGSDNSDI